jgi:hypothetical protein
MDFVLFLLLMILLIRLSVQMKTQSETFTPVTHFQASKLVDSATGKCAMINTARNNEVYLTNCDNGNYFTLDNNGYLWTTSNNANKVNNTESIRNCMAANTASDNQTFVPAFSGGDPTGCFKGAVAYQQATNSYNIYAENPDLFNNAKTYWQTLPTGEVMYNQKQGTSWNLR